MTATPPNDNGQHGQQHGAGQGPSQGPGQGPSQGPGQAPGQGAGHGAGHGPGYGYRPDPAGQRPDYGQGGQQQGPVGWQPPQPMSPSDQRLWATLIHIGGIFFQILVPLIGYLVLRDRGQFIKEHARVALNFHLTMLIAYVVGILLTIILVGALVIAAVGIVSLVFAILAAVAANDGRFYRYPLSIEFIKA